MATTARKILSATEESINMLVHGKELMIYYNENQVDATMPCKICGAVANSYLIEITSIVVNEDYSDVPKDHQIFKKVEDFLRKRELHDKPYCGSHMAQFYSSRDGMRRSLSGQYGVRF